MTQLAGYVRYPLVCTVPPPPHPLPLPDSAGGTSCVHLGWETLRKPPLIKTEFIGVPVQWLQCKENCERWWWGQVSPLAAWVGLCHSATWSRRSSHCPLPQLLQENNHFCGSRSGIEGIENKSWGKKTLSPLQDVSRLFTAKFRFFDVKKVGLTFLMTLALNLDFKVQ